MPLSYDDRVIIGNAARSLHDHFCPVSYHLTVEQADHQGSLQLQLEQLVETLYGPFEDGECE